jgi:hypothetical protein
MEERPVTPELLDEARHLAVRLSVFGGKVRHDDHITVSALVAEIERLQVAKQIEARYPTDERVSPAKCQHNWLHETVGNERIEVCHKCGSENLL